MKHKYRLMCLFAAERQRWNITLSMYVEILLYFCEETGKGSMDENQMCAGQNSFGYEFLALRLFHRPQTHLMCCGGFDFSGID